MALARWQSTIVDDEGNIVPNASVEVRLEVAGLPLATIYSDRNGGDQIANPANADSEGFVAFHAFGGAYRIRAFNGGFERIWRYVGIGTGSERDGGNVFIPRGPWDVDETYSQGDLVSHSVAGSGDFTFVSNDGGNLGNEPSFVGSPPEPESDEHWTVLGVSVAGTKGDAGDPGEQGIPGSSDVVGTSTTNLEISVGAKAFTVVEDDRGWGVGARLRASSDANPTTHYMEGVVTGYSGNTLNITIDLVSDTGSPPDSRDDWTINLAGEQGVQGMQGEQGIQGATGDTGPEGPPGSIENATASDIAFVQPSPPLEHTDAIDVQQAIEDLDAAVGQGGGGQSVHVGDTPPGDPEDGQLWFDTGSGGLFIWFDDGDSSQWAELGASGSIVNVTFTGPTEPRTYALPDSDQALASLDLENQPLTGGVAVTSKSLGTVSTGTLTLDLGNRPLQHYTNNGAHTLAPGTVSGAALIDITNDSSAGAITLSGWTKVSGSFTTTNGHKFRCHASLGNGGSLLSIQALQ